ncbi:STAS domain-containing protein [Amycolatopsis sp. NPDC049253]|uniref:STAS domain-containing protein n=1 Tax=Amycolatopsis sp. NPDC049253 TaxID=3155274 RepID=UPI003434DC6E
MARTFKSIDISGRSSMDVKTLHLRPGQALVTVSGDVDMATAPQLADAVNALCRTPHHSMVVDLTGVDFLSVRGIAVLLSLELHCRGSSTELSLIFTPAVRRTLERLDSSGLFGTSELLRPASMWTGSSCRA